MQAQVDIIVLGGMGLKYDDYLFFRDTLEKSGAMGRTVMFIHTASDPTVECTLVPDLALAVAEQFALDGKRVLVLLTDMTNYADAQKEMAITMEQVPSNRGYPGDLYSCLAARYEKAVDFEGAGSITILGVTTMPGDDVTHPVPDNTGYITEGQIILSRDLYRKGIIPPVDVLPSLSRLKDKGIGEGKTREDHSGTMNQLFAAYARGKDAKELMTILGEAALSDDDKQFAKFADAFEQRYVNQGNNTNRTIEDTLNLGWELLSLLPRTELKRIKPELIEKYMPET